MGDQVVEAERRDAAKNGCMAGLETRSARGIQRVLGEPDQVGPGAVAKPNSLRLPRSRQRSRQEFKEQKKKRLRRAPRNSRSEMVEVFVCGECGKVIEAEERKQ
jgi:hypothetical protein